jgi:hypothetical protein
MEQQCCSGNATLIVIYKYVRYAQLVRGGIYFSIDRLIGDM